eukprot:3531493-Rhodomonas_salina.1
MLCALHVLEELKDDAPQVHLIFSPSVSVLASSCCRSSHVVSLQHPERIVALVRVVLELHDE